MQLRFIKLFVLPAVFVICFSAMGQDSIRLFIGDEAPPIKYSKWLKGTPVTGYEKDRLYVLEFWATWCGPCIAAMPHLSELAKKYENKATFIGVDVWEKTGSKPYDSSLPGVMKFVNSSDNRMSYNVIADNSIQEMASGWLKAAGISGIPTTFVVKNGRVMWIGHPHRLDSVMEPIIADTFDIAAYRKKYDAQSMASLKMSNDMKAIFKGVNDAEASGDYSKAFQLVDEGIQKMPMLNITLKSEKFRILLRHFPEAEMLNYARQLNKEGTAHLTVTAGEILARNDLSKEAYLFAADNIKKVVTAHTSSMALDKLAEAYQKAGDLPAAIETEEKAIVAGKRELTDPAYGGYIFDYTIAGYEEHLAKYKKAVH